MTINFEAALQLLGLNNKYTRADLNKAYKKLALAKHPDKVIANHKSTRLSEHAIEQMRVEAEQSFKELSEAKDYLEKALSDPSLRVSHQPAPPVPFDNETFDNFFDESPFFRPFGFPDGFGTHSRDYFDFSIPTGFSPFHQWYANPFQENRSQSNNRTTPSQRFEHHIRFQFCTPSQPWSKYYDLQFSKDHLKHSQSMLADAAKNISHTIQRTSPFSFLEDGYSIHFVSTTYKELLFDLAKSIQKLENKKSIRFSVSDDIPLSDDQRHEFDNLPIKFKLKRAFAKLKNFIKDGRKTWNTGHFTFLTIGTTCATLLLPAFLQTSLSFKLVFETILYSTLFLGPVYALAHAYYNNYTLRQAEQCKFSSFKPLKDEQLEALWAGAQSKNWTGYFKTFRNSSAARYNQYYYAGKIFAMENERENFLFPLQDEINKRETLRKNCI